MLLFFRRRRPVFLAGLWRVKAQGEGNLLAEQARRFRGRCIQIHPELRGPLTIEGRMGMSYRRSLRAAGVALVLLATLARAWGQEAAVLPGPAARYTEVADGAETALAYFTLPEGPVLVFSIGAPGKSAAGLPLREQAAALSHLLDRFLADRQAPPKSLQVKLGDSRAALIGLLDDRLMQPQADWDVRTGRPRRGQFGTVLARETQNALQASPLGDVFASHGYRLSVDHVSRIDVAADPTRHSARLPAALDVIDIIASRDK